ncbi:hypothetical protein ASG58_01405 [Rhizobium sp. Leaf383]|nr:hypothetical protein ASG58_01405 [Rhizobium sp. Leaf383]
MPLTDYRDTLDAAAGAKAMAVQAEKNAADAKAAAKAAQDLAASIDTTIKAAALVWEYYYTASRSMLVSLALTGDRLLVPAAKAAVGDLVFIHPAGRPTIGTVTLGFLFFQSTGFVKDAGVVDVNCVFPSITVAGQLSLPLRLRGFRPPAA